MNFDALSGGGQNLERRNVERPVFQNFEIANINIKNDSIILISNFFSSFFRNYLDIQNI